MIFPIEIFENIIEQVNNFDTLTNLIQINKSFNYISKKKINNEIKKIIKKINNDDENIYITLYDNILHNNFTMIRKNHIYYSIYGINQSMLLSVLKSLKQEMIYIYYNGYNGIYLYKKDMQTPKKTSNNIF